MKLRWTRKALSDLDRLHAFLTPVNAQAAARRVQALVRAPNKLREQPRLGMRLEAYNPREVRRFLIGDYELRYEIAEDTIHILDIWHGREDR